MTKDIEIEPKFTKKQLIDSNKYKKRKDLLTSLLNDDEQYSIKEVDDLIEKFMKGKVK